MSPPSQKARPTSRPGGPTRPPRPPASTPPAGGNRRTVLIVGSAVVVVLLALAVAIVAGSSGGDDTATTGGPGNGAGASGDPAPVTVQGDGLAPLPDTGTDPAVGQAMPILTGTGFDGEPLTVPTSGRPSLVMFVAHWCPHCQAEVPIVQQWVDDGGLPAGVDLFTVSTAVDPRRGNYPPAEWLASEGWTAPVLADDADQSAAEAVGLTAFPFFVAVDADGNVVGRGSGELTPTQLDQIAAELG